MPVLTPLAGIFAGQPLVILCWPNFLLCPCREATTGYPSSHFSHPPSRFKLLYLTKLSVMRAMGLAYLAADYMQACLCVCGGGGGGGGAHFWAGRIQATTSCKPYGARWALPSGL